MVNAEDILDGERRRREEEKERQTVNGSFQSYFLELVRL